MDAIWEDLEELAHQNGHIDVPAAAPIKHQYAVRMLKKENPDDWAIVPHLLNRVRRFCEQYEAQASPDALITNIQQSFVMDDPGLVLLAFWRNDELIGHVLCDRAILYHNPIITVHQYWLDHGIPAETRRAAIEMIKEWGKETGPEGTRPPAQFVQWLVRDQKLATMYQRFFKAKPHLLLMRMPTED